MTIVYTVIDSDLGTIFSAETRSGVIFTSVGPESLNALTKHAERWFPGQSIVPSVVDSTIQIQEYLSGMRKTFDLALLPLGTDFQMEVWQAIQKIPYGETWTYKQIAQSVGHPNAYQAVGQACGANPIPIIIPCHRVLNESGALGGFGLGLDVKKWLLRHEGHQNIPD